MRAGDLRHALVIEQQQEARDGFGAVVVRVEEIPWDATSCCGNHKSVDLPLADGGAMRVQHEPPFGYVVYFMLDNGLMDSARGMLRGLDDAGLQVAMDAASLRANQ